jgi:glutaredoxin 3
MPEFTTHTLDSAPHASRQLLQNAEKQLGFIPNLLGAIAESPALPVLTINRSPHRNANFNNPYQETLMNQVKILTSPSCSYCHAAKDLLQREGIAYQEVDAFKDSEQAQQLLIQSGQRTVPQFFINKKPIGGITELSQLLNNNEVGLTHSHPLI